MRAADLDVVNLSRLYGEGCCPRQGLTRSGVACRRLMSLANGYEVLFVDEVMSRAHRSSCVCFGFGICVGALILLYLYCGV